MSEGVTGSVIAHLEKWATEDARIAPDHFACLHYKACNASVDEDLQGGKGCCMSYVGPNYGEDFRLAIVGMDHGDFESFTFEGRREGIQNCYVRKRKKFNQHYAGVVKTAASILGKSGDHCRVHCLRSCHATKPETCVIDRISQPNLVKCTPRKQNDRTSRSSWGMKSNCARHLLAELRILRPNVIVFHGIQSRGIMRAEFERAGVDFSAIEARSDTSGPALYGFAELGAHFLFLYHPSHGWLAQQWPQVEKWIGYLRERGLVPE
jgi:hypothetical protein